MVFFKDSANKAENVIQRYIKEVPAVGYELQSLRRETLADGMFLDFTENSLDVLEEMVRDAARGEQSAMKDEKSARTFMLRNRHVIGRVGAFLGCLVIENVGGTWLREEGGLVVAGIGEAGIQFDPFEAVIKAVISPGREPLKAQYAQLKEEIKGTGPRVRFRERVLDVLKRHIPGVRIGRLSGLEFWLMNGTRVHLGNLFTACAKVPEAAGEAIEGFVEAVTQMCRENGEVPGFEDACGRLFPVLKTRAFMSRPLRGGRPLSSGLAWEEFLGLLSETHISPYRSTGNCDLAVCFVLEGEGCFRFVRNEDVEKWCVPVKVVRNHALDNLADATAFMEHDFAQTRYGRAVIVNANDGYDASRILLPGLGDAFRAHLGEDFFVAVPCRDLLVAFENREGLLALMRQWIRDDAHLGAYGLTDALFICGA